MRAFTSLTSHVVPLDMNDIDTDMIIPAQFLTKIDRDSYGEHLFQRLKERDASFVLNDPYYQSAKILLSKINFGCGSSREHAVWALQQAGIHVIIAESFSDIFSSNAAKNGLLLVRLPSNAIATLMRQAQQDTLKITVDLQKQILITTQGEVFDFAYDPFRKSCLLQGLDDLDYLLEAMEQ